ncbi:MAG: ATPase, partial [Deltaproteobacteria bacterium]|nr:ATPase [Deltaproteobacteria bacterium]
MHIFDFVEWDRNEIKKTIGDELGWRKPPDSITSWRFDCHLHSL